MGDDDQQQPAQRYWFRYWTGPPQRRPAPRPQPSPSRRPSHPQAGAAAASRGAGAASPQAQPQPTRLPSRPSPSRAPPLTPIREPNVSAAPVPVPREPKTPALKPDTPRPAADEVPKQKDIIIPLEKIIHEPPADSKPHSKAIEKEKEKDKDKEKEKKDKDKEDEKETEEHKEKKEKEKEHKEKKEKEKEKEKEETKGDESKAKEKISSHGGKLHKELKAGVADMVHKLGASAPSTGHERPAAAGATVITLAGENKGASMKVTHAEGDGKDSAGKERRGHKIDGGTEVHGARGLTAFVNSNVQVLNNSLLLQSSCSGGDPGVHLKLSTKSKKKGDGKQAGGKGSSAVAAKK